MTDLMTLAETGGTELTRFNALRHGVLSRYTVLPWEGRGRIPTLLGALVDEQCAAGTDRGAAWSRSWPASSGASEGCAWPRRPPIGGSSAGTLASYRETAKMALVHLDATDQSEPVDNAIRGSRRRTPMRTSATCRTTRP